MLATVPIIEPIMETTEAPLSPKMSPSAIITVNMGAVSETPATMLVSPVCATKYVSIM